MPGSDSPRFIGNSVASFGPECKFENMVQIENKCMSVDMFTKYKPSVFTCLDVYGQEQTLALQDLKEKFKKKSRRKQTLIFEMVGTMIKLLDPAIDVFSM